MAFTNITDFQYIGPGGELTAEEELFVQTLASRANYNANNVVVMNSNNGGSPGQVLRVKADGTGLEWADISGGSGGIGGTIATGQVAFGTADNTIGGDSKFVWDNVNKNLIIGDLTPGGTPATLYISGSVTKPQIALYGININDIATIRWDNARLMVQVPPLDSLDLVGGASPSAPTAGGVFIKNNWQENIAWFRGDLSTRFYGDVIISPLTPGSVLFAGTGGKISQDNSNLFWDNTNKRLGIGTATPTAKLDVAGNASIAGSLNLTGNVLQNAIIQRNVKDITTESYTAVLEDAYSLVRMSSDSGKVFIIPANSTVNFPITTTLLVINYGDGKLTIEGENNVIIRDPNYLSSVDVQYDMRAIIKIGNGTGEGEWVIQ